MSAKVRLLLSLLALLVGNAVAVPLDESEANPVSSSQDQAPVPDLPTTASPPSALSPQGTEPKGTGACGGVCKEQFPVPVCGSDGRIYHSECVMKQMTCRKSFQRARVISPRRHIIKECIEGQDVMRSVMLEPRAT
ncbi:hypothetical protein IscW_ISCW019231 [Ixodes scapularis]|uniref:Kazal-like domain-containing protein n=1 Tax=Ixodes scapularis TaxID=6945 RepID=B7PPL5_IXOSC|nr:hypothetical protein IscW_ISCW019231 [Ixodes scapularis]|eukprot:XP_002435707.1 hypothetical protein IscW_ISCW019231 [Ixodes scapularis]